MTEDRAPHEEPTSPGAASRIVAEALTIAADAASRMSEAHPPRPGLDQEMQAVKDGILRMGSLVIRSPSVIGFERVITSH